MGRRSKDLLELERKKSSSSSLESTLLVCKKDSPSHPQNPPSAEKLVTASIPKSQVLGKVKDFLGVMAEANKRLQLDAEVSHKDYDIEVLTGNETEYIEMDLMLGVADLHTPEAVAAAESAITNSQPVISLAASSTGLDSEDGSDDDDDNSISSGDKFKKPKLGGDDSNSNDQPKKRPKIVELQ